MKRTGVLKPFYKIASFLYEKPRVRRAILFRSAQVEMDLKKGNLEGEWREAGKKYYENKIAVSLMILFAGSFFAALIALKAVMSPVLQKDGSIVRGEETREVELALFAESEDIPLEKRNFRIEVAPRLLAAEEIQPVYEKFAEKLPELIRGQNETLEQVSADLLLLEAYEGYPFLVEWTCDRPDIISGTGTVYACDTEEAVEITAVITYADFQWTRQIPVRAAPEPETPEEKVYRELEAFLTASEEAERRKQEWRLPEVWEGKPLEWREVRGKDGLTLWITFAFAAVAVYFLSDRDLHEKTQKRKAKMKQQYPDVIHKLVLYLGAGMTVRGAFGMVAGEQRKEGQRSDLPAYEEMRYTFREIQAGVSERVAYERFGKRSGLQEYIRLSMLLSQNLKKGNAAFMERLRQEAEKAYLEHMQNSRRMTEEAVTKLLLPMVMLLVVVMVIVMVPAFFSMGI